MVSSVCDSAHDCGNDSCAMPGSEYCCLVLPLESLGLSIHVHVPTEVANFSLKSDCFRRVVLCCFAFSLCCCCCLAFLFISWSDSSCTFTFCLVCVPLSTLHHFDASIHCDSEPPLANLCMHVLICQYREPVKFCSVAGCYFWCLDSQKLAAFHRQPTTYVYIAVFCNVQLIRNP